MESTYKTSTLSFFHGHYFTWFQLFSLVTAAFVSVFFLSRQILDWDARKEKVALNAWVEKYSALSEVPSPRLFNVKLNFPESTKGFNGESLSHLNNMNYLVLRQRVLNNLPPKLSKRLEPFIDWAFLYAEENNLDPFWVISISWSESHFNPQALSSARAVGIMQLLPRTAASVMRELDLKVPKNLSHYLRQKPRMNMRLGTYYLKNLLDRFSNDYKVATVAYNMGPTWTSRRLRQKKSVGVRNNYLSKVHKAYHLMSRGILKETFAVRTAKN